MISLDPRLDWCTKNVDKLRVLGDVYAAITAADGLVAYDSQLSGLRAQLERLNVPARDTLIVRATDF